MTITTSDAALSKIDKNKHEQLPKETTVQSGAKSNVGCFSSWFFIRFRNLVSVF